ncbi:hypothetical protein BT63DRAFT_429454 [Microthyrium microscopicum]|uniref:Uncharacterized protein n=1 Tax=Microthyrium microscopicum TaxID=703497 RepID=A0A6A6TX80_9PEZI|nr:hypothetical protein BT63DRAFT_429454 [Microthyrium microscopicum]
MDFIVDFFLPRKSLIPFDESSQILINFEKYPLAWRICQAVGIGATWSLFGYAIFAAQLGLSPSTLGTLNLPIVLSLVGAVGFVSLCSDGTYPMYPITHPVSFNFPISTLLIRSSHSALFQASSHRLLPDVPPTCFPQCA